MLDDFAKSISKRLIDNSLTTCSRWAQHRIWTPPPYKGPLNFERFPWQKEILDCMEPQVSVQKCSQSGLSVSGIIKSIYMIDQKKTDVLYVLPTEGLAGDFSKTRFDQMIALSPDLQGLFQGVNNVKVKTTKHHSHLFVRGSVSERNLVSVPVGTAIVDEWDRCNQTALALAVKRMSAHEEKHLFVLSTPTLPDHGINKQYKLGTMERFFFPCIGCGRQIQLLWEDSIEICGTSPTDPDCHKSYLKCPRCGVELPHNAKKEWLAPALWVPGQPDIFGHRSFHINQMYAHAMTPGELVVEYFRGEISEPAKVEFTNQVKGEPHLLEGARLTDAILDDCIGSHRTDDPRPTHANRQIVMGVDVGSFLDIVIAEYIYDGEPGYEPHLNSICKVLWSGRLPGSDFPILDRLMAEWQVKYACVDFEPYTVLAKAFARRFHGYAAVTAYREGTTGNEIRETLDDDRVPVLILNRTAFLDMALGRFHKKRIILPANTDHIFREHLKNLVRTYELDPLGRPRATYVSLDADHLAHALNLTEVAHMRSYSKATGRTLRPNEAVTNI
jgi:hypothetical protein